MATKHYSRSLSRWLSKMILEASEFHYWIKQTGLVKALYHDPHKRHSSPPDCDVKARYLSHDSYKILCGHASSLNSPFHTIPIATSQLSYLTNHPKNYIQCLPNSRDKTPSSSPSRLRRTLTPTPPRPATVAATAVCPSYPTLCDRIAPPIPHFFHAFLAKDRACPLPTTGSPKIGFSKRRLPFETANESGVDESVTSKFPGSEVTYGSAASGAGDNREIPESEGGDINPTTGQ